MTEANSKSNHILDVDHLTVSFGGKANRVKAVDGISFFLERGQCLGIVGESGSGKSVTSLSILHLLEGHSTSKTNGTITFRSEDRECQILNSTPSDLQKIRGRQISMVFQEPMSSLNPVLKCGRQVREVLDVHKILSKSERRDEVLELFHQVRLKDPVRAYDSYPHELSGGQLQRINIAMALAGRPQILICDEPTTALDVTIQKEIIQLLRSLVKEQDISLIFVCHDLDIVSELCDSVLVMYEGKIVESGLLPETFLHPKHLYTSALLKCKPRIESKELVLPTVSEILDKSYKERVRSSKPVKASETLLKVQDLGVKFLLNELSLFSGKKYLHALKHVNFHLYKGEILGIVGESGSGKSTIANCIAGLIKPSTGYLEFQKQELTITRLRKDIILRRSIQLIFQDPYSSLNPRMTVGEALREPIKHHDLRKGKKAIGARVRSLLDQVGLSEEYEDRYPHELSGGQRQRVCIARALSVEPVLLICDECVSALDVSVQAQILNLLDKLRRELELSMIFISHDLSVVHYISDRILVMSEGLVVEDGLPDQIMQNPQKAYTQSLIDSIPKSI